MKQPKIKIFGGTYNVVGIDFNRQSGEIEKVVYEVEGRLKQVFKGDTMVTKSLDSEYKIQKPTEHPYYNYSYAPDLNSLIVTA